MIGQAGPIIQLNHGLPASKMTIASSIEMPRMAPSDQGPRGEQRSLAVDLFLAISSRDNQAVIELARMVDHLDSHRDLASGDTPLIAAARCDLSLAAVSALLPRSNPLLKNNQDTTALIFAAYGTAPECLEIVRLLLPVSDPLARSMDGDTALHFSIFAHRVDIVELLLPASDLQSPNFAGNPPLEQALGLASSRDTVQAILAEMARRERVAISGAARQPMPKLHAPSRL